MSSAGPGPDAPRPSQPGLAPLPASVGDTLPSIEVVRQPPPTPTGPDASSLPAAPPLPSVESARRAEAVPGYEVLGELGRGGMGVVYKARQQLPNRLVALKMIRSGGHASEGELQRFLTEAEAVARLQHEHIVRLLEYGRHDGLPYFTLEFVPGGSLADHLRKGPLAPREAARLVEQLARGMHYAHHQHGIVHRDLKPANILLQKQFTAENAENAEKNKENSRKQFKTLLSSSSASSAPSAVSAVNLVPKIADFGLAKRLDVEEGQTGSGSVLGTPSYMAPEQAAGRTREVGPAADVYALGAILYECLTGRPPFKGATPTETLMQVLHDEPVPPSRLRRRVPRDLETICLKCLEKEPARRYASAAELAEDLRCFQADEPVLARPVSGPERLAKWVRRRPAVAALLAAVALSLAGGTIVSTLFALEARDQAREAEDSARQATERGEELAEALDDVELALADSLLRPVGSESTFVYAAERGAFRELARMPAGRMHLLFIERALADGEAAERLGRRAEMAARATAGLDLERREQILRLLRDRLRQEKADPRVRVACIRLGLALGDTDPEFLTAAARTVVERMAANGGPNPSFPLAAALKPVADGLDEQGAEAAIRQVLERLAPAGDPDNFFHLSDSLIPAVAKLSEEEAANAARQLVERFAETHDPVTAGFFAAALKAVASRLTKKEAEAIGSRFVEQAARPISPNKLYLLTDALRVLMLPWEKTTSKKAVAKVLSELFLKIRTTERKELYILGMAQAGLVDPKNREESAKFMHEVLAQMVKPIVPDPFKLAATARASAPLLREDLAAEGIRDVVKQMAGAEDPYVLLHLAGAFAALADRADENEARRLAAGLVEKIAAKLERAADPATILFLATALRDVIGPLGDAEARRRAVEGARKVLDGVTATDPFTLMPLGDALAALVPRLDDQDLVNLLKNPTCVGPLRFVVLSELGRRFDCRFDTVWDFAAYARKEKPKLDLLTPPRRAVGYDRTGAW